VGFLAVAVARFLIELADGAVLAWLIDDFSHLPKRSDDNCVATLLSKVSGVKFVFPLMWTSELLDLNEPLWAEKVTVCLAMGF